MPLAVLPHLPFVLHHPLLVVLAETKEGYLTKASIAGRITISQQEI